MSTWRDRCVFVTGANGFLGSYVVRRLADEGAQVVCLVRPHSRFRLDGIDDRECVTCVPGVVEDFDLVLRVLRGRGVDTVIHLAAQAIVGEAFKDPLPALEANVRGTYHVLEAARRWGDLRAVVVSTSDKVYGESEVASSEGDRLAGRAPYDASKVCADVLAQSYARSYKLPVGVVRAGNLYGPGDVQWSRLVPGTIRSLLRGERPIIRSDGSPLRDYFYVEDAADGILALASALDRHEVRGEAVNLGTGVKTSALSVVRMLIEMSCLSLEPVVLGEARGEIREQCLDCEKAERLLGWQYRMSLAEGLAKTWAYAMERS